MHQKKYDPTSRESRRDVIASVIASQRIEGVDFDEDSLSDLEAFVEGTMDMEEVHDRAIARFSSPSLSSALDI